jgi:hypothetical protein
MLGEPGPIELCECILKNGGLLQRTENVWQYETADRQPEALATENPAR